MNELGLIMQNGKVVVSSRKVAEIYGKRHADVMRDIRNIIDAVSEAQRNFAQSVYINEQNREMPEYTMDRQGFSMLVMGLTGKKAKEFTYKYTKAFEEMANTIHSPNIQGLEHFQKDKMMLEFAMDRLKVNKASEIKMIEDFNKSHDLDTSYLPHYTDEELTKSLSELLKENNIELSAVKINRIFIKEGILEEKTRPSSKVEGKTKKFKAFTEEGLKYGCNMINPKNQKETQPRYYPSKFLDLISLLENK